MDAQITPPAAMSLPYRPKGGVSARSRQRFFRDRRRRFYAYLGGKPSDVQVIAVERLCRGLWDLQALDLKIDSGEELAPELLRVRSAMETRLRNDLAALKAPPAPKPVAASKPAPKTEPPKKAQSLDEYLTSKRAEAPVP